MFRELLVTVPMDMEETAVSGALPGLGTSSLVLTDLELHCVERDGLAVVLLPLPPGSGITSMYGCA